MKPTRTFWCAIGLLASMPSVFALFAFDHPHWLWWIGPLAVAVSIFAWELATDDEA